MGGQEIRSHYVGFKISFIISKKLCGNDMIWSSVSKENEHAGIRYGFFFRSSEVELNGYYNVYIF